MNSRIHALLALMLVLLLAAACGGDAADPTADNQAAVENMPVSILATPPPPAIATNTPIPPTPTPTAPLAATVNGELLYLADYERELARYEAAWDDNLEPGYETVVLNALIERELIQQAAAADGVTISADAVETRLSELRATADEFGGFDAWLETNLYTEDEFRNALTAELVTGEMVNRVTAAVPTAVEQVRARYIQMDDGALAQSVLERARAGEDFAALADQNSVDRVTGVNGGDLGFFARDTLLVPEVEAAAFALQPTEISQLITATREDGTTVYFIVQVTERDPARELTADARSGLLQEAFMAWLDELWTAAKVERFVP